MVNGKQIKNVDEITNQLSKIGYISNVGLSTSIYLLLKLKKPILLEGEAGVGKTELAKSLSKIFNKPLVRLSPLHRLSSLPH